MDNNINNDEYNKNEVDMSKINPESIKINNDNNLS